jgi:hypothetical protein
LQLGTIVLDYGFAQPMTIDRILFDAERWQWSPASLENLEQQTCCKICVSTALARPVFS